ncbi:fucokinase [Ranunculus cassubicifolius]
MANQTRRRRNAKPDISKILRKSWYNLRLSVRHPSRVPTWDAIILTAASPEQAQLYQWQLNRAKRMGRIAIDTVTLTVPDPLGSRIGSGAATINAISVMIQHFTHLEGQNGENGQKFDLDMTLSDEERMIEIMSSKHVLLLHAGGDSKRVPWANPMGKVFLPLPYLADDDPDGPVPLLFDHILAISSCARQGFKNKGGIFIMTGDVLPCFDASTIVLPEDSSCIITVPITLDIASNHGVIVASKTGTGDETHSLTLVENLLQKPSVKELVENQAILHDGRTLLDTGIIAVRGKAWIDLLKLASSNETMISDLLKNRKEISLYEDVVAAWVPARHEWLKLRPFGSELINGLGSQTMFSYCAYDLSFLHFGTSSEILGHLAGSNSALVGRRHLCSIPATTVSDIASSAIVLSSKIAPGVSIGEDTMVYDSSLLGGVQLGSQSIVVGVNIPADIDDGPNRDSFRFILPDRHCLWEVPLVGRGERVIIYCGLHDNPKIAYSKDGTFCGRPWKKVMHDLGIQEGDLWSFSDAQEKCLWNAKIFPILPYFDMLNSALWLMGLHMYDHNSVLLRWRSSERISLEELHKSVDFIQLCLGSSNHQADLAAGIAKACISYGLLGRNLAQLSEEILQKEVSGIETCKDLLALCPNLGDSSSRILPQSRTYQVQADLLRACGEEIKASTLEEKVWAAIADETASAVKYGYGDNHSTSINNASPVIATCQNNGLDDHPYIPRSARVELAVRVDFVGGWSDTPPWSLERSGCVLNMAICLEGSCPVGTIIETTTTAGVLISDDTDRQLYIEDTSSLAAPFDHDDPFRLVKSALLVSDIIHDRLLLSSKGLKIQTWAKVPRGSGLGTSSILAAAVVKGLLQIMEGDESNENVARLVLVLEQIMGTGGGWQDQIGGLYPGIKFTASFPGVPLRLQVIPLMANPQLVSELEQRLLVVFTGQVRLANQVLQKVVTRYLQHDNLLITSIKRLAELAKIGREALMNGDVDELGEIMLEAWRLHQELDPHCSNTVVDRLFELVDPFCSGYKLVGAGGGGFALLLAKSADSAIKMRLLLEKSSDFDVQVYNWSIFQNNS